MLHTELFPSIHATTSSTWSIWGEVISGAMGITVAGATPAIAGGSS